MITEMVTWLRPLAGIIAGGAIGWGFGLLQEVARRRYERRQQSGNLHTGWAVVPGSMSRIAYLLMALVLVQALCPLLFTNGAQWAVSAGVALGYGLAVFSRVRHRAA
jgi:hypothetical protein